MLRMTKKMKVINTDKYEQEMSYNSQHRVLFGTLVSSFIGPVSLVVDWPAITGCLHWWRRLQGRGRKLMEFSYMHHPTKNDVTSGLNCDSQLVSQSEKMAFRLLEITLYL